MSWLDHILIQLPGALTVLGLTDLIIFWTFSMSNFFL
jgi:hypothetical protein